MESDKQVVMIIESVRYKSAFLNYSLKAFAFNTFLPAHLLLTTVSYDNLRWQCPNGQVEVTSIFKNCPGSSPLALIESFYAIHDMRTYLLPRLKCIVCFTLSSPPPFAANFVYRNFATRDFVPCRSTFLSSDFIPVFEPLSNSFKRCCCCMPWHTYHPPSSFRTSAYASAIIAFVIAILHPKPSPLLKQSKPRQFRFYPFVVVVHINDHQAQRLERFLNSSQRFRVHTSSPSILTSNLACRLVFFLLFTLRSSLARYEVSMLTGIFTGNTFRFCLGVGLQPLVAALHQRVYQTVLFSSLSSTTSICFSSFCKTF